jgi:hypothetical protein
VIFLLPEVGIFYSENRGFRCQDANFDAKVALINPPISEKLSSRRTSAAGLRDQPEAVFRLFLTNSLLETITSIQTSMRLQSEVKTPLLVVELGGMSRQKKLVSG